MEFLNLHAHVRIKCLTDSFELFLFRGEVPDTELIDEKRLITRNSSQLSHLMNLFF